MKAKKADTTKIIVNLTRKSQNWNNNANEITKKQTLYKTKKNYKPKVKLETVKEIEEEKQNENVDKEKPKIWFEVDKIYLPEANDDLNQSDKNESESNKRAPKITKVVAMDCEMVGVGADGRDSVVARVSLVNQYGECIYDKYVVPTEKVTDYRTHVSGIRPEDVKKENGSIELAQAQKEVAEILEGKKLVGHAIHNDLQVLYLSHPKKMLRDTQKCKWFRQIVPNLGGLSSLKNLTKSLLGLDIQQGEHNSVHDAQATMRIYTTYKKQWEEYLRNKKLKPNEIKEGQQLAQNVLKGLRVKTDGEEEIDKRDIKGSDNHKRYVKNKLKKRLFRKK
jgi:RNA exonuclease 4